MSITLSSTLTTEMASLSRRHASRATVEQWLPEWSPVLSGLSSSKQEQYAHGHAAAVAPNANGAGEDVLFRCRSGHYNAAGDSVGNSYLYISVLKGTDLDNPANWDSKWTNAGAAGLMWPAWTANSGGQYGGSLACVWTGSVFRVFFSTSSGYIYQLDFNTSGAQVGALVQVAALGTNSLRLASMQFASCNANELFVAMIGLTSDFTLEDPTPTATWQKPVYGSMLYRYVWSGAAWVQDARFPFYTHMECALMRDSQFKFGGDGTGYGNDVWGNGSANAITAQWGKRPCGGLAANEIDANTVVVSAGFTFWKRYGYNTHNQGILSFTFYRDSGLWERNFEAGLSDYVNERLDFDAFARGCKVEGNNFLVWSRNVEPSDFDQLDTTQSLPRTREVVYAKISADGKFLTQYQYLGSQDDLTSAAIVAVNHAGSKSLYALGWRAVYKSDPAGFACTVPNPQDLELCCDGWQTQVSNRWSMQTDLNIEDASALFVEDTKLKPGYLVRIYAGTPSEQVQIAQGLIDTISPSLSLEQETHRAKAVARAEKGLLDPRSEEMHDTLPQQTLRVAPTDPIKNIAVHNGYWDVQLMEWPSHYFPGSYDHLQLQNCYRLLSFPYANTGGDQGPGYPGMCLDQRAQHKGTWFNDLAWTGASSTVDGSVQASVRFGTNVNKGNFTFWAREGSQVYAQVLKQNGIIMGINWRTGSYSGPRFNPPPEANAPWGVAQHALMAGVICHAAEVGKKYAFVWECNSYFGGFSNNVFNGSSHTDDTWRKENFDRADYSAHGVGWNRLYLIESDYDETNPKWNDPAAPRWIHKSIAGGLNVNGILTPGQPADLRMIVIGGTIYCFFRPHHLYNQAPSQWYYAFNYEAGRFGAGRFGIIGRGHAGIQWDSLFYQNQNGNVTGRDKVPQYDNYVDFWDVNVSDGVKDKSLEEAVQRHAWQGFTPTVFNSTVSDAGPVNLASGAIKAYTPAVENLTVDFKVKLTAAGNEAGVIVRAVNTGLTNGAHFRVGIVAGGALPGAGGQVTTYGVFRYFTGGGEDPKYVQYGPFPLTVPHNVPVPVRITSRGNIYSIWIAGNYAGHFLEDLAGGPYFGLYASGTNVGGVAATFTGVRVPELYEIPEISSIDVNQTAFDAIKKLLGKRSIKGVFQPTGSVRVSYFETHDTGPTFQDSLTQSAVRLSDRFASIVRVDGAYTFATYASEVLLKFGRRFMQVSLPDIFHREFAFREAKNICTRMAEDQVQSTFEGLPDYRVQPEDKIEIFVDQQDIAGHYLVDDVSHTFQMDQDDPQASSTISTRRSVVI